MFDGINKWLDGKKTLIAGIAAAFTSAGVAVGSLQDGFQTADLAVIGGSFAAVMAIFGFGGKFQKIIDALNALKK